MGGLGSGRQGHCAIIESGMTIDLRRLRRQGLFRDGYGHSRRLSWNNGASCWFSFDALDAPFWFRIEYSWTLGDGRKAEVDERMPLSAFPQPFGGRRWYFICPSTGTRVQTLHCPPGATRFRSRQAFRSQVRYLSQGIDRSERNRRQAEKLRKRMLEAGPAQWRIEHEEWEFPPKPPGMRWGTYNERFERWEGYEAEADMAALDRIMKLVTV